MALVIAPKNPSAAHTMTTLPPRLERRLALAEGVELDR